MPCFSGTAFALGEGLSFRPSRVALVASILACTLGVPTTVGAAGAVLPLGGRPDPAFVDVRMAVAATPTGSTRWTEITVPAATTAMWLVPVRPGAAVDWAAARWLDALDEATGPQILPPSYATACAARSTPETPASWTTPRAKQPAPALAVQTTADDARAYVAERGYRLSPALSSKLTSLYAGGWNLVALEMSASSTELSSGTLRVSDDGGAVLPLTLSGGSSTRLTVFAIGAGVASVPGTQDVDRQALRWGPEGSTFAAWRSDLIRAGNGTTWLRESASHDALFDGTSVAGGSPISSVVTGYFRGTSCSPTPALSVGSNDGVVGIACAPGAATRVPGGTACVPSSGSLDPAALSCVADIDLALAFSGLNPASAVVTRLVGWVPAGALGTNLDVGFQPAGSRHSPAIRAGSYEACAPSPTNDSPLTAPSSPRRPGSSGGGATAGEREVYIATSDGCGGGPVATGTTYDEESEPAPADDSSSTESCSGSGSSSGWDDSDESDGWDDSDSGDSCSSDDSSSSSDSCSGGSSSSSSSSSSGGSDDGWDTEDSDDGWDTEDDMSPKRKKLEPASKKPHAKATKKKASPVSRYALLAVALILPLRRRRREPEAE